MDKFEGKLSENSLWITATPTVFAQQLPFYIAEAGHFSVDSDYMVSRDFHDSFLLLYTCSGMGCIKTGNITIQLPRDHAVIIDCHIAHEYFSQADSWDFLWIHFNGSAITTMFEAIYPDNSVCAINMEYTDNFRSKITSAIDKIIINDIKTYIDISLKLHSLLNSMYCASLKKEEINQKKDAAEEIKTVIAFIENNYSEPIMIDDMINLIHISKYHFIRRFKRTMGVTPYHYLTNYRITAAKTMLRTTSKTVAEIAELCGFSDTSNFITQFKKQTGQKPLEYRHDFT